MNNNNNNNNNNMNNDNNMMQRAIRESLALERIAKEKAQELERAIDASLDGDFERYDQELIHGYELSLQEERKRDELDELNTKNLLLALKLSAEDISYDNTDQDLPSFEEAMKDQDLPSFEEAMKDEEPVEEKVAPFTHMMRDENLNNICDNDLHRGYPLTLFEYEMATRKQGFDAWYENFTQSGRKLSKKMKGYVIRKKLDWFYEAFKSYL